MKRHYLGDSYDAVKRLWQELLANWAPLYAEPMFIPEDVRREFSVFTRIPMLPAMQTSTHSIFNDPDTGIRLPYGDNQSEGRTHIVLSTIRQQLKHAAVRCVLTYDQSHHRLPGFSAKDQRNAKVQWLANAGCPSFYYVSHAPFLFAFPKRIYMDQVRSLLGGAGIPEGRIKVPE